MGLVFLIKFDQTPNNSFYLCRCCQAHIALSQHYHYGFNEEGLSGSIFSSLGNVHTLGPEHDRDVGDYKIEVPVEELNLCEADFLLKMPKLLMWNGHEIVDAYEIAYEENY